MVYLEGERAAFLYIIVSGEFGLTASLLMPDLTLREE
jgi:CRP-like cAMP-binding protein